MFVIVTGVVKHHFCLCLVSIIIVVALASRLTVDIMDVRDVETSILYTYHFKHMQAS